MKRMVLSVLLLATVACGSSSPTAPPQPAVAQYGAIWQGSYVVSTCSESGLIVLADICGNFPAGKSLPFKMTLAQVGSTIPQGVFLLGTIAFTTQPATIAASNALSLVGTNTDGSVTIVTSWSLTSPFVGTQTQTWTATGVSGQAIVTSNISSAVKVGSVDREPFVSSPSAAPGARSIPELFRAINEP